MNYEHDPVPNPKNLPPDERAVYAEEAVSLLRSIAKEIFLGSVSAVAREDEPKAGCLIRYKLSVEGGDIVADGAQKGVPIVARRGQLALSAALSALDAEAEGLDGDAPGDFLDAAERTAPWTTPSGARVLVSVEVTLR